MGLIAMIFQASLTVYLVLEIKQLKNELWETTEDLHKRLDAIEKRQSRTQGLIMKDIKYED
jgi:hypothetical protein